MLSSPCLQDPKRSTPPAEERVTSFFTRVKKEVTKKESTSRQSAPWEDLHVCAVTLRSAPVRLDCGNLQRCALRLPSSGANMDSKCEAEVVPDIFATLSSARGGSSHGALCSHVLSFLVTLFFTRVKKRVTRSSVGGVEALALLLRRRSGSLGSESYPLLRRRSGSSGSESYPLLRRRSGTLWLSARDQETRTTSNKKHSDPMAQSPGHMRRSTLSRRT